MKSSAVFMQLYRCLNRKKGISTMTDIEKSAEVNSIIASLREKYSLDDIRIILIAARLKVSTMICYGGYLPEELPEEFDDQLIDESDLPF